jgi:hypothetical protein
MTPPALFGSGAFYFLLPKGLSPLGIIMMMNGKIQVMPKVPECDRCLFNDKAQVNVIKSLYHNPPHFPKVLGIKRES